MSVCYDFERGRMAEKWQKMPTIWANIKQIAREPEVNKIVKQRTKFRAGDQWQGDGREPGARVLGWLV